MALLAFLFLAVAIGCGLVGFGGDGPSVMAAAAQVLSLAFLSAFLATVLMAMVARPDL